LNELTGASYGRVLAFYRRNPLLDPVFRELLELTVKEKKASLSSAEKKALAAQGKSVPADIREKFEKAFAQWKSTWFEGGLAINSVPQNRGVGNAFDALVALGPKILPLVVEKLVDPDNFFALTLYDAIQPDEKLIVQFTPDDERILEGQQGRARRVVQAWFANR
jgi:hypothetical protein